MRSKNLSLRYVKAFSIKLRLWEAKLTEKNIIHCHTCKSVIWEGAIFSSDEYVATIEISQQDFDQRFSDLKISVKLFRFF